jgi:hypothetical protein
MDTLETIPNMSIAELRKVLSDNDVIDTSQNREELIQQVSQVFETNLLIERLLQTDIPLTNDQIPINNDQIPMNNDQIPVNTGTDPRTIEIIQQDIEYQESLKIDQQVLPPLQFTPEGNYIIQQPDTEFYEFEELSPNSLRQKRLEYYS